MQLNFFEVKNKSTSCEIIFFHKIVVNWVLQLKYELLHCFLNITKRYSPIAFIYRTNRQKVFINDSLGFYRCLLKVWRRFCVKREMRGISLLWLFKKMWTFCFIETKNCTLLFCQKSLFALKSDVKQHTKTFFKEFSWLDFSANWPAQIYLSARYSPVPHYTTLLWSKVHTMLTIQHKITTFFVLKINGFLWVWQWGKF